MVESESKAETNVNETADEQKNGTQAEGDISDLEKKIIRQVEYYFGDINLLRDKFLQEQIKLDDGWVPLETMLKFNRLSTLSKEAEVILTAIRKSKSGLMEISEDKTKIRRSPTVPLPEINEDSRQELTLRTVYCKGFPLDSKLEELLEFFNKYEDVINVVMRNYNDKATQSWNFKGSIFINFKTVDAGDKFLKLESVKYKDVELTRMWMKDYIEFKRKERLQERSKRQRNKSGGGGGDNKNAKEGNEEEGGDEEAEEKEAFPTGTVVQLTGFKVDKPLKREQIKDSIEGMGISVAFIDYSMGDETAWVRLEEKDSAQQLAKKVEEEGGTLVIEDNKLTLRTLDKEEEETFLEKALKDSKNRKQRSSRRNKGFRKGRGGRGKWGNNRKRKGSPPSGNQPAKVKVDGD